MSYSRWSTSHWYTYWHAGGAFDRDDQYFDVCGIKVFTYGELKGDIEACLSEIREKTRNALENDSPVVTEKDIEELKGYMKEFIADVEGDEDINFYEDLKIGKITPELLEWSKQKKEEFLEIKDKNKFYPNDEELIELTDEAFKILYADDNELPLFVSEAQTDIGKSLLEKRLKGEIKQLKKEKWF